jgi:MFS family permease
MLPGPGVPVPQILAAFAAMGLGLGGASVASTHAGTEGAEPSYQGVASGVLNSSAQIGTSLGLAILAPLATAAVSPGPASYRIGFIGTGVLALAGLVTSLLLPRRPPPTPARTPARPQSSVPSDPACRGSSVPSGQGDAAARKLPGATHTAPRRP